MDSQTGVMNNPNYANPPFDNMSDEMKKMSLQPNPGSDFQSNQNCNNISYNENNHSQDQFMTNSYQNPNSYYQGPSSNIQNMSQNNYQNPNGPQMMPVGNNQNTFSTQSPVPSHQNNSSFNQPPQNLNGFSENSQFGGKMIPPTPSGHFQSNQNMAGGPPMSMGGGPPVPNMAGGPPMPNMTGGPPVPNMAGGPPMPTLAGRPQMLNMAGAPPMPNMAGGPQNPHMSGGPPTPMYGQPYPVQNANQMNPNMMSNQMQPSFSNNMNQPGPPMPQNQYSNYGYNQAMINQPQTLVSADNLPNVVDVIAKDKDGQQSVIFGTAQRNVTPPLVTTDFICQDEGNCNPRFIRSSLYAVPNSSDMLNQTGLNFTITCSPFAKLNISDTSVIISDMGPQGPVRCNRCKAYMNPYNQFVDGGRKFQCSLCNGSTDTPTEYFAHVDHTGRRSDATQRPELCLGSYELYATKEYCRNNILPKPPAYIFLLDVSQPSLKSGFLQMFCSQFVSKILPSLPRPELSYKQQEQWLLENPGKEDCIPKNLDMPIGFITYGNQLHFYSFNDVIQDQSNPTLTKKIPHMNIVADAEDMFVPGVEGFLINSSNTEAISNLMDIIPNQFLGDSALPAAQVTLLGPAIQAGLEALKASTRSGKLFLFHTCLPTAEAPGRLKNREDSKIIGSDKEKSLLVPLNNFYTELGQTCVQNGCSIDYFLMPTSYVDIATISEVPKLSGGRIYKYPCFQADRQGDDLMNDLACAVTLPQAFDCVMRLRTSTGTRPVDFFANAHIPNSTDIEVGAVDSDWALTSEIKHDDKLREEDIVIIQLAVLFTSLSGERRLRIHNLTLATTNKISELYLMSDHDAYVNWLAKSAVRAVLNKQRQAIFEDLTNKLSNILAAYKKLCCNQGPNMNSSNPGQLFLPERLKVLPYFIQSIFKTPIIKSGSVCHHLHNEPFAANLLTRQLGTSAIGLDTRSLALFHVMRMDVLQSATYLYPRIYPIHELSNENDAIPMPVRCSFERLAPSGAYLLDNGGFNSFLWLGNELSPEWLTNVFGVNNVRSIPDGAIIAPRDNEVSARVNEFYRLIRSKQTRSSKLIITRQATEQETWFKMFMYEDAASDNTPSYTNYLIHVHKEIRSIVK